MKNAFYQCPDRRVWEDEDGKPHSCHAACEQYAINKKKIEEANKRKREETEANNMTSLSVERIMGRYKWNKG